MSSQNPPIRELPGAKPDEIWVIQINLQKRDIEPRSMPQILDRRNELAGNLSLNQEIHFIKKSTNRSGEDSSRAPSTRSSR